MNMIHAAQHQTKFTSEPHLSIWIDDEPVNDYLDRLVPDIAAHDLVPTWLDWMIDDDEQEIVYSRMTPDAGSSSRVPILMCPDDLDFCCSVVIADVSSTEDAVVWRQVGLDTTQSNDPAQIGTEVSWFPIPELRFKRDDYLKCVRAFERLNNNRSAQ